MREFNKMESAARVDRVSDVAKLMKDFVALCADLDEEYGTFDSNSLAGLASVLLDDDVEVKEPYEEVKELYADLIAECIAYGKDAEIEEQKDYAMYRLGELYEEGRIGDPMVSEIIEDRIEEHFRCNDCNLFMACKDCYYLDK